VNAKGLSLLQRNGLDMLELGVQSFDDAVLAAGRPGYTGEEAVRACALVKKSGLALGVQLMPGLPGMDAGVFRMDVQKTLDVRPETLRLYPCLVIDGTPLAGMWRKGDYAPWGLDETIFLLAGALLAAERNGIAVIRMGLAPEPGLKPAILAGPEHPSLGSRVRGRALFNLIYLKCAKLGRTPIRLSLPRRLLGEFSGHRGEFTPLYKKLDLEPAKVRWHDRSYCELTG
jgi:histone acetyltransferase (RNA polymerase elongator complex component)